MTIGPIEVEHAADFAHLAIGPGRGLLTREFPGRVAIGAWSHDKRPAGLFLGHVGYDTQKRLFVINLRVAKGHRRQGVGTTLLARGEAVARAAGCEHLRGLLAAGSPEGPAAQTLAERAGWARVRHLRNVYKVAYRLIESSPWMLRSFRWPAGFEVFPWHDLTEDERTGLLARRGDPDMFDRYVDPFQRETEQTRNSVGLKVKGEIAGWAVSWYLGADFEGRHVMSGTYLFVRPGLQRRGFGAMLLAEHIRRSRIDRIDYGIFTVDPSNEFIHRLVKRHLTPYTTASREIWEFGKQLMPVTEGDGV